MGWLYDEIERRPPYVLGVFLGTLYAATNYVWGSTSGSTGAALIGAAVGSVVWTVVIATARQRDCDAMGFGSESARAEVVRVLRIGVLPADPSQDERIRRLLERRRRQCEWGGTTAWVVITVVPAGLLVAGLVQRVVELAAIGAVGLVLVPVIRWHQRRVLDRYRAIEAELDVRAADGG